MDRFWQPKSSWATPAAGATLLGCLALPLVAAEVRVEAAGLRNEAGTLYVAVCSEAEFLQPACAYTGSAPASEGAVTVAGVPPGTYAVQAVHDENGNGTLDRPGFLPLEGLGFSRDARMFMGPPAWDDAAFDLTEAGVTIPLTLRYFQ